MMVVKRAIMLALMLAGEPVSSFAEPIVFDAPEREPGRVYPGLGYDDRNWILGKWVDDHVATGCSQPALRIYMMAMISGDPGRQYIAGTSGALRLGAVHIKKIVIDDDRAEAFLFREPSAKREPPYGDPVRFRRLSSDSIALILPDDTEYKLRFCPGSNRPPVSK